MSYTPTPKRCLRCQTNLSPYFEGEICSACLLSVGLESSSDEPSTALNRESNSNGTGLDSSESIANVQALFPDLEILEIVGQGGMGVVYRARQKHLGRQIALKLLRTRLGGDPTFEERFTREARALAKLSHPNIVAVFDFGQAGDRPYLIMEYVDGTNLRQMILQRSLSPQQAIALVPPICDALQFAHEEGVVHRDIKPENILIDRRGRVRIADFGLARITTRGSHEWTLTGTRQVMGTPHYMAPEQVDRPLEVDHRADIFSLGVVIYEMLTGELPIGRFEVPSRKVNVDVRLDEVVLRTLENEPARRYQYASEVQTDVNKISMTPPGQPAFQKLFSMPGMLSDNVLLTSMMIDGLLALWAIGGLFFDRDHAEYVIFFLINALFIGIVAFSRRQAIYSNPDRWWKVASIAVWIPLHFGFFAAFGSWIGSMGRRLLATPSTPWTPPLQTRNYSSVPFATQSFENARSTPARPSLWNWDKVKQRIKSIWFFVPWRKGFQCILATLLLGSLMGIGSTAAFFLSMPDFLPSELLFHDPTARRVRLVDSPVHELSISASGHRHWLKGTRLRPQLVGVDRMNFEIWSARDHEAKTLNHLLVDMTSNEYRYAHSDRLLSKLELSPTLDDPTPIQKWLTINGVKESVAGEVSKSLFLLICDIKDGLHTTADSQGNLRIKPIVSLLDQQQFSLIENGTVIASSSVEDSVLALWVGLSILLGLLVIILVNRQILLAKPKPI